MKVPRRVGKIIDVALGDMFTFVLNGKFKIDDYGDGDDE